MPLPPGEWLQREGVESEEEVGLQTFAAEPPWKNGLGEREVVQLHFIPNKFVFDGVKLRSKM